MEVGEWVQVSLGFFWGKSSQNSPNPVLIFWSSIPCVFCLYTLLNVVGYYNLSVMSMSVMVSKKKIGWGILLFFLTLQGPLHVHLESRQL